MSKTTTTAVYIYIDDQLEPGNKAAFSHTEQAIWLSTRLNRAEQVRVITDLLDTLNFDCAPADSGWSAGPALRLLVGGGK